MNGSVARLHLLLLPASAQGRMLAAGAGIDSFGTGIFFASSPLYFVGIIGFSGAEYAMVTTCAGALALLAPVPIGHLADRLGPARFYVALLLLRGVGYGCFAFVSDLRGYAVLTLVLTAADRSSSPIQQVVVTAIVGGRNRTRTLASIRAVRNVGLTLGFLAAGVAVAVAEPTVFAVFFVGNGLSFAVVAALVRRAMASANVVVGAAEAHRGADAVRSPFRDGWFVVFTAGNAVLSLYDTVLLVLLPIWVIENTAIPAVAVPALMAANTVLTVLMQVYVARFADGVVAATRMLVLSGFLMAGCCGLFAASQLAAPGPALAFLTAAVLVLTVAENLHSVAAWEVSAELSPADAQARYLGAFSLSLTGQKVFGPSLLVVVLLPIGIVGWPVLAGAFGAASIITRTAVRRCLAERMTRPCAAHESSEVTP